MKLFFGGTHRECGIYNTASIENSLLVGLFVCDKAFIGNNTFVEAAKFVEVLRSNHRKHGFMWEDMLKVRKPYRADMKIE